MRRLWFALLVSGLVGFAGCFAEYEVPSTSGPSSSGPVEPTASEAPEADQGRSEPVATSESADAPSAIPMREATSPPPSHQPPSTAGTPSGSRQPSVRPDAPGRYEQIRLSAGVALPQSLPTGTTMGFSIDYQFTQGRPSPSSPYAWVIEPSRGQPVKQPVQLRERGTLQGFVPGLRPEHGPFKTHIEDAQGNRLSASAPLR